MADYIQVFTTVDNKEDASKIADKLIDDRLAGCVQVLGPMTSMYWWERKKEVSQEWLIIIKSKGSFYKEIEDTIKKVHPYETPEIVAVPIVFGSKDYLNWLDGELKKDV